MEIKDIEKIKKKADKIFIDIIGQDVNLKKRGKNYSGICPKCKSNEFLVSNEYKIYHCFKCGFAGNIFNFIMYVKKLSFVKAVQFLDKPKKADFGANKIIHMIKQL